MNTEFSLGALAQMRVLDAMRQLSDEAHDNAVEHGFHKTYDTLTADAQDKQAAERTCLLAQLALIGSEVGEAVREVQHGNMGAMAEELGDVVIRILDVCGRYNINLGQAIIEKMTVNRKRPYLHGKEC